MAKLVTILAAVVAVVIAWNLLSPSPKQPVLDPEEWWGPMEMKGKQDTSIRPFTIKFEDAMIKDLKQRLKSHRPLTPPLEGIAFEYGFNTKELEGYLKYWAEEYPFKEREKALNQFPQFKTNIQGLDIHFVRVTPKVPAGVTVVPLLILHGWPGSVREFYEVIPLLTKQRPGHDFVFEVIAPSMPGFGFSDGAVRPGVGPAQIAVIYRNLMQRLGFNKFYIQGGNWGSGIAAAMDTFYPEAVLGHHDNGVFIQSGAATRKMILGAFFPSLVVEPHLADRLYPLSWLFSYAMEEFAYLHLHGTKPDTVGVSLSDSPSGLAGYILEKFSTWTNRAHRSLPDGGLKKFSKEQLIDNLMIYWTSNSINSAIRIYANALSRKYTEMDLDSYPTNVPTWVMQTKHELFYMPPSIIETKFTNVLNYTVLDYGGHFIALEMPEVLADDLFKAVKAFRNWHKNNKTKL
ncbi:PREDICTED: juvenile hormone epoxide hydrolase-like [Papilio polytes]|uniref:juvenile hormone epoxide hydrolase-like n=1 Tax=Papilio polytes TaxID=76194 RepID=UPI000675EDAE|nr:PREDICTED: juvenile hormone epoxide hydrolase-like [Papilio polytes]